MWLRVETHHPEAPSAVVSTALHADQKREDGFLRIKREDAEPWVHSQRGPRPERAERRKKIQANMAGKDKSHASSNRARPFMTAA